MSCVEASNSGVPLPAVQDSYFWLMVWSIHCRNLDSRLSRMILSRHLLSAQGGGSEQGELTVSVCVCGLQRWSSLGRCQTHTYRSIGYVMPLHLAQGPVPLLLIPKSHEAVAFGSVRDCVCDHLQDKALSHRRCKYPCLHSCAC